MSCGGGRHALGLAAHAPRCEVGKKPHAVLPNAAAVQDTFYFVGF